MSRSRGAMSLTTVSPMRISPSLISSSPASILSAVDLPHPDGPTRTMNSVSLISRLRSLTARMPPAKRFVTCSKVTDAIRVILVQGFCGTGGLCRPGLGRLFGGTPQLRRGVLRLGVVDESACPNLDSSKVLQPVCSSVWGIELDVKVGLRPRLRVGRGLVHGHDVWSGEAEMTVIST